jgi:hypothetical protein
MTFGFGPYLLASSLLNTALRRGEKKSDSEKAIERQNTVENQRHQHRLKEIEQQHKLGHEYRSEEQQQAHLFRQTEQKKSHTYRLTEQKEGHKLREQELEKNHEYRSQEQNQAHLLRQQEQTEGHKYRLEEQTQASWHRCREIALSKYFDAQAQDKGHIYRQGEQTLAHHHRKNEIAWSNELQLHRDLQLRQIVQEHALEIEQIRHQYAVQTAVINRSWLKSEENSPFVEPTEQSINMLRAAYQSNMGKPLVVIAPFWDDTLSHKINNEGGFLDYRAAINAAWQRTQWFDNVIKCDGYLKRPLHQTDRDIAIISAELADIPVILLHGMVQGRQKVHPYITIWNLLPNQGNSYFNLALESFEIKKPNPENRLEFQDYIAHYVATVVGILSDARQLFLTGKRPCLSRYAPKEAEKLKLLASQFGLYYDLICYEEPMQEQFYRLDQAVMLYECDLLDEAHQQIESALTSWQYQKTRTTDVSQTNDLNALAKLANREDKQFFHKLAEIYQLVNANDKVKQVHNAIEALKTVKYQPIARLKR